MAWAGFMDDRPKDIIAATVARMPEWIRHDLVAKDAAVRTRAEETLAAMIAGALAPDVEAEV